MSTQNREEEAQLRASINQQLIESGDKERIKASLRQTLQRGEWRDQIRAIARQKIEENSDMSVEDLVAAITPEARQKVPQQVRDDLLNQIRASLQKQTQ
eukprot:m.7113 g.7113  ORF g.7113 m.7113 type:complete len:99 (-) comp2709_c0_seq1:168-464(-)